MVVAQGENMVVVQCGTATGGGGGGGGGGGVNGYVHTLLYLCHSKSHNLRAKYMYAQVYVQHVT